MRHLPMRDQRRLPVSYTNPDQNGVPALALDADYLNPYTNENQQKDDLSRYLKILYRRKWYVIVPVLLMMPLILLLIELQEPVYRASSRLLIKNSNDRVLNIQEVTQNDQSEAFYPTEHVLIRSEVNVSEVIHKLNLLEVFPPETWDPVGTLKRTIRTIKKTILSWIAPSTLKPEQPLTPEEIAEIKRQEALSHVYKMLRIAPLEGNMLVDVTFEDTQAKRAALIVNNLVDIYARNHRSAKLEAATNASAWLTQQAEKLREQMYEAERKLQQFRKNEDFVSLARIIHKSCAKGLESPF